MRNYIGLAWKRNCEQMSADSRVVQMGQVSPSSGIKSTVFII